MLCNVVLWCGVACMCVVCLNLVVVLVGEHELCCVVMVCIGVCVVLHALN